MKQPILGAKINELRKINAITQKELADKCKVDIRTIQRIECGEVMPRMYTLNLLSAALDYNFNANATIIKGNSNIAPNVPVLSIICGMIYSTNILTILIRLATQWLTIHQYRSLIYPIAAINFFSGMVFIYGFYILAKQSGNRLFIKCSLLAIILLPSINMLYLIAPSVIKITFMLFCINSAFFTLLIITRSSKKLLRTLPGIIAIVLVCIFLNLIASIHTNVEISSLPIAGMAISVVSNLLLIAILFFEYQISSKKILFTDESVSFG